jgi:hypothetical protein
VSHRGCGSAAVKVLADLSYTFSRFVAVDEQTKMQVGVLILIFLTLAWCDLRVFKKTDPNPLGYVAYKLDRDHPIKIDGKLDDAAWQQVPWTPYFVDIQGSKKPLPRYKTHAKIRYDDQYLYIGAWLEEPNLVATLKQRDSVIYHDNDFEVFINPSGNVHLYQEFEMNAFNTIWNLVITNPYRNGYNIINPYPLVYCACLKLYCDG